MVLTLDEAIIHAHETAKRIEKEGCIHCANEHKQLAAWLEELKSYKKYNEEDRDTLEEYIKRADILAKADYDANYRLIITAKDVRNIPRADVAEVKHGHWVPKETMIGSPFAKNYYCSECFEDTVFGGNYCSNCGAKMDFLEA